jgi:hypothetical protein
MLYYTAQTPDKAYCVFCILKQDEKEEEGEEAYNNNNGKL